MGTFEEDEAPRLTCKQINSAACKIAKEVADEHGTIVCGGITQTETYVTTKWENTQKWTFCLKSFVSGTRSWYRKN